MKVYELIRKLSYFEPNTEVTIAEGDKILWKGDFTVNEFFEDDGTISADIGIDDCRVNQGE